MQVQVTCKSTLDGKDCSDIVINHGACYDVQVTHTFTYCNLNQFAPIRLLTKATKAIINNVELPDFDETQMAPNECREKIVTTTLDSCTTLKQFYGQMKMEGWMLPKEPLNRYCYAFDFQRDQPEIPGGECDVSVRMV